MFSLRRNGRNEMKRFTNKKNQMSTFIHDSESYYYGCNCYTVGKVGTENSCVIGSILESSFYDSDRNSLTVNDQKFKVERVIVVGMK